MWEKSYVDCGEKADKACVAATIISKCKPRSVAFHHGVPLEIDREAGAEMGGIHQEIGDINLAYLLLAQKLIKQDRAAAMFRLGIGSEMADLLTNMSVAQIVKLAASNLLLCSFRLGDLSMFAAVGVDKPSALQQAHMSILMAARQTLSASRSGSAAGEFKRSA